MAKYKKSAAKKTAHTKAPTRSHTDWQRFFELCKANKPNEQIAKALGWHIDPKSKDGFKRVRAAKSLARTKGIRIGDRLVFLRDAKQNRIAQPKPKNKTASKHKTKMKASVAKPEATSQPKPAKPEQGVE